MDTFQPIEFRRTYVERQDPNEVKLDYDRELDTLFIDLDVPDSPRSTYYLADGVNIVFDPTTNEIVGFRVEDWQLVFLRQHSDLRRPWFFYKLMCRFYNLCNKLGFSQRDRSKVIERVKEYALGYSPA